MLHQQHIFLFLDILRQIYILLQSILWSSETNTHSHLLCHFIHHICRGSIDILLLSASLLNDCCRSANDSHTVPVDVKR